MEDKRVTIVKGYFVSNNNSKNNVRLQTDDGSYLIRSLDSIWVWSAQITKLWVTEKFCEWPEWSLYGEEIV